MPEAKNSLKDQKFGLKERPAAEMVLFKQNVKEMNGALADYLKEHVKAEHNREFE